jgi:hypothetical protein
MKGPQPAVSFFETVLFIQLIDHGDLDEIYPFKVYRDGMLGRWYWPHPR